MRRARLAFLLTLLALSLVALFERSRLQAWAFHSDPAFSSGQHLPEFPADTRTLDGERLRLADLRGQVVLVHFWTFACGNCEHMLPSYSAWDKKFRASGLRVVGVHTPELPSERDVAKLRAFVKEKDLRWPVISDVGYLIWDALGVKAWPTIFVLDRGGKIQGTFVGDDRSSDIETLVKRLL